MVILCETREKLSEEIKYSILKELNHLYNACLNGDEKNLCNGIELSIITVTNLKFGGKRK